MLLNRAIFCRLLHLPNRVYSFASDTHNIRKASWLVEDSTRKSPAVSLKSTETTSSTTAVENGSFAFGENVPENNVSVQDKDKQERLQESKNRFAEMLTNLADDTYREERKDASYFQGLIDSVKSRSATKEALVLLGEVLFLILVHACSA